MPLQRVDRALSMMRVHLVEYATQNDWGEHRAAELAQTIIACLRRTASETGQQAAAHNQRLARETLRHAVRFVNDNLDSKLKWDEIATAVGLDPFTFGRGFKLATGITPHQYIIRCRLRRALRLLAREELSLADIALEVGCSCQSHLTTLFRKYLGTTPGALRLSAREDQERVPRPFGARSGTRPKRAMMGSERSAPSQRHAYIRDLPSDRGHAWKRLDRMVALQGDALSS